VAVSGMPEDESRLRDWRKREDGYAARPWLRCKVLPNKELQPRVATVDRPCGRPVQTL
jgi:hypothetical protein